MKKFLLVIIILFIGGTLYLLFSPPFSHKFVSINEDNYFELNHERFYPVTINYCASIQSDGKSYWVRPHESYDLDQLEAFSNKDFAIEQFKKDIQLIKEMGFNSIRLCKIGQLRIDTSNKGKMTMPYNTGAGNIEVLLLNDGENEFDAAYQSYFDALDEMFEIIDDAGLKVVFLVNMRPYVGTTKQHLNKLARHFKHNTVIMAYDLYNEPLYFDTLDRSKESVVYEVNTWDEIVNVGSRNHHLTTIGLEGIREVFEWDPNLLSVDFMSFHPYEYELEQVRNEIYWYGKYVKKPWIIGETAIPADNDSITYAQQHQFAENTLKQTINCGGIGYSWWQFKEVIEPKYHASYMGVVDMKGNEKPVAEAFKTFVPEITDTCQCYDNYYNYSECDSFTLTGEIVNENNEPIHGAVVLGWNKDWSHSYHTITKPDGTFQLKGCYTFYYWMLSAVEYTMERGDVFPDSIVTSSEKGFKQVDLGKVQLKKIIL